MYGSLLWWIAGQVWAHHCCAAWSEGVIQTDDYSLRFVDKAVFAGVTQVAAFMLHFMSLYAWNYISHISFSTATMPPKITDRSCALHMHACIHCNLLQLIWVL